VFVRCFCGREKFMTAVDMHQQTYEALLDYCKDEVSAWADRTDVREYDFSCPHRFMPKHHQRLRDFSDQVGRNASVAMSSLLRAHYKVTSMSVREEYAVRHDEAENCYYIPLRVEQATVGYYCVPAQTAIIWITSMLGGICKGEVDDSRELSALENDLLTDIAHRLTESFTGASREFGGADFVVARDVTVVPPEFEDQDEKILQYCRFSFERVEAEYTLPYSMIVLSHMLEPIAGLTPPESLTPAQARERLLGSVNEVEIPIQIRIDLAEVAVGDIATLETGDVLMLGRRVNEPVDVLYAKTILMTGVPVQFQGRYGVCVDAHRDDMPPPLVPLEVSDNTN
jgi:flagellar motor switch protein FliM